MAGSIMQDHKECYLTGSVNDLHKHHVFGGSNRKNAEKWGCWVWLRADYHNMSNHGIHFNKALDLTIKQDTQKRFEQLHGHKKFMEIFGRNYLQEERR
ncbi:MAG: hypothetical protein ABFD66_00055 [Smithella sp.]